MGWRNMRWKLFFGLTVWISCNPLEKDDGEPYQINEKIYEESFDLADTSAWIIEAEDDVHLTDCVSDGAMDLSISKGITVWNTARFKGNVMFEFEVTVIEAGGANDRVSDLNCFWMATDPDFPDDFFQRSSWRGGKFWNYYSLNLYYVGYGGHDNSRTRLRKYDASVKPQPPVLAEYDDPLHLIEANKKNTIRIICFESRVIYFFNGEKVFDITDELPYTQGYFGFRTTHNHMKVHHFKVFSLRSGDSRP